MYDNKEYFIIIAQSPASPESPPSPYPSFSTESA